LLKYVVVGVGGFLGAIARYVVGNYIGSRFGVRFPYGTFVINITACVIIGFSLAFLGRRTGLNPVWRFLIPVGFVGAYSTFSTFEWEIFSSLQTGGLSVAGLYVVLSVVLGLVAVWCGALIAGVMP